MIALTAGELGHLSLQGSLHQQLCAEASHLVEDLGQLTIRGEQLVDLGANAVTLIGGGAPADPNEPHEALHAAAIAYPAGTDLMKEGDKKSSGTFLEGHLVAATFDVSPSPTKSVAATLDIEIPLP